MKISGIQNVSFVDYDGYVATTIFTSGCNFSCPFCHNSSLVNGTEDIIPLEDIFDYLKKRRNVLSAVCISGGEPTLHHDLPEFISKIKDMGYKVKLDTNGTNLLMLKTLVENNLIDYVAMDIKNCLEKYNLTSGCNSTNKIQDSIEYIMSCGIDYEFRTTLVQGHHTKDDILKIGQLIKGAKKYYLQKFKNSENCLTQGLQEINIVTASEYKDILSQYVQNTQLRGY